MFCCSCIVFPVPGDYTFVVPQGKDARINWKLNEQVSDLITRVWCFRSSDGGISEVLAFIIRDGQPNIENGSLPGVEIEKPATLVLKNVSMRYNGVYSFRISGNVDGTFLVTLFVAGKLLS